MPSVTHINRRALLHALSLSPFVLTGVGAFSSATRAEAAAAGLISANVCILRAQETEGPRYLDRRLVRRDITEGRPGVPMDLHLQVVDAECAPIGDVRVDVWHCDALGSYSGFAPSGTAAPGDVEDSTFLRGTQMSGADGVATFRSIYPGWYCGRAVQVHYKVFLDRRNAMAGQILFPDALSEYLFRNVEPYSSRAGARVRMNAEDGISVQAGSGAFAAVREQPAAYEVSLVVAVDPAARRSEAGASGEPAVLQGDPSAVPSGG